MTILAFGINHATAPVDLREKVIFGSDTVSDALGELTHQQGVNEAAILSTCNRTEIYCSLEEAKFEADVKNLDMDQTISSLSNSIRREIIQLLGQNDKMRLMAITRKLKIEDHTKVVFHLRTLKESDLIQQSEDKSYSLTKEGKRVLKSLHILSNYISNS